MSLDAFVFFHDVGEGAVQAVRMRKIARRVLSELGTSHKSRIESVNLYEVRKKECREVLCVRKVIMHVLRSWKHCTSAKEPPEY